jgi:hypothetical protein
MSFYIEQCIVIPKQRPINQQATGKTKNWQKTWFTNLVAINHLCGDSAWEYGGTLVPKPQCMCLKEWKVNFEGDGGGPSRGTWKDCQSAEWGRTNGHLAIQIHTYFMDTLGSCTSQHADIKTRRHDRGSNIFTGFAWNECRPCLDGFSLLAGTSLLRYHTPQYKVPGATCSERKCSTGTHTLKNNFHSPISLQIQDKNFKESKYEPLKELGWGLIATTRGLKSCATVSLRKRSILGIIIQINVNSIELDAVGWHSRILPPGPPPPHFTPPPPPG